MHKIAIVCLSVFAACSICVASPNASLGPQILMAALDCMKAHPISISDILAIKNTLKIPDTKNANCFLACVLKRIGLLNDEGKFNTEKVYASVPLVFSNKDDDLAHKSKQVVDACTSVNTDSVSDGNKGCERARLAFNCLVQNAPKFGLSFKL